MNCLAYALRFWKDNPDYVLYYNSNHVINAPKETIISGFLLVEEFGYNHFKSSFQGLLDEYEEQLLREYFTAS